MKAALLALVTTVALFLSTGTASAQLRYSTFNNPVVVAPGVNPLPFASGFTPSAFTFPGNGFASGFGNFNPGFGNGYTTPAWNYGFVYGYPTWSYGFVSSQPYWNHSGFGRPYGGYYGSTSGGNYYGLHRHHWNH
jgi:hypothetical protein